MQQTQLPKQGTTEEMAIAWQISKEGNLRQVWHDGSTVGQQSLLLLVPSRHFAVALLTNAFSGEQMNLDIARVAIKEYLDVTISDPRPLNTPGADLAEYVGKYSRPFADVILTVDGDRLLIQRVQKQGFPTPASPIPPPGRPTPFAFYAHDRLIATEGPQKGARAEFLRRPDGTVGWIRFWGRLARKQ